MSAVSDRPGAAHAALVLSNVSKRYDGASTPAVDDVSIEVPAGRLLGLLGPSGCGKTTLLRMIAGLIPVSAGRVRVGSRDITRLPVPQRDIGLVFQSYALFPHMSVAENVAFGLRMRKLPPNEIKARVAEALAMVRLPDLGQRLPRQLSGGQQQRVALARALVIHPSILLLDEPLSNLDAKLRDEMRFEITEIQRQVGITTVFVTHDQTEALTMCDLVGVMEGGRLRQLASPEDIYENPASLFVASFVGRVNALPCVVTRPGRLRVGGFEFGCQAPEGFAGAATATLRPHRIALSPTRPEALVGSERNVVRGVVRRSSYIGDTLVYDIDAPGIALKVEAATEGGRRRFPDGEAVMCEWLPSDMRVFAEVA